MVCSVTLDIAAVGHEWSQRLEVWQSSGASRLTGITGVHFADSYV